MDPASEGNGGSSCGGGARRQSAPRGSRRGGHPRPSRSGTSTGARSAPGASASPRLAARPRAPSRRRRGRGGPRGGASSSVACGDLPGPTGAVRGASAGPRVGSARSLPCPVPSFREGRTSSFPPVSSREGAGERCPRRPFRASWRLGAFVLKEAPRGGSRRRPDRSATTSPSVEPGGSFDLRSRPLRRPRRRDLCVLRVERVPTIPARVRSLLSERALSDRRPGGEGRSLDRARVQESWVASSGWDLSAPVPRANAPRRSRPCTPLPRP